MNTYAVHIVHSPVFPVPYSLITWVRGVWGVKVFIEDNRFLSGDKAESSLLTSHVDNLTPSFGDHWTPVDLRWVCLVSSSSLILGGFLGYETGTPMILVFSRTGARVSDP